MIICGNSNFDPWHLICIGLLPAPAPWIGQECTKGFPIRHSSRITPGNNSWTRVTEAAVYEMPGRACDCAASLIHSWPENLTISSFSLWDDIIPAIILRVCGLLALQCCTSGSFVLVCNESLCVCVCVCARMQEREEEKRPRMSEESSVAACWLAEFPSSHSLIGQLFSSTSGSLGSRRHTELSW